MGEAVLALPRVVMRRAAAAAAFATVGLAVNTPVEMPGTHPEAASEPTEFVEAPELDEQDPVGLGPPPSLSVRSLDAAERPTLVREALEAAVRWAEEGQVRQAGLYHAEAMLLARQDPDILSNLIGLEKRYRHACAAERRFTPIRDAFEAEDFHTALSLLYRLPAPADSARTRRALANGWYNLAIVALRAGRCDEAKRNLAESAAFDPRLGADSEALVMAERCRYGPTGQTRLLPAERLRFRAIGD